MPIKTQATLEDLYRVPENGKAEIVNGELRLMSPTGALPNRAAGETPYDEAAGENVQGDKSLAFEADLRPVRLHVHVAALVGRLLNGNLCLAPRREVVALLDSPAHAASH